MSIREVLILAFSVSLDAFAVSIAGAAGDGRFRRNAALAALFFGGFQFLMPLAGFFPARLLRDFFSTGCDRWIAFALLGFVGGKMIYEALRGETGGSDPQSKPEKSFFTVSTLFAAAVATSLDALTSGAGIAFAGSSIWLPAAAMGAVTALMSAAGVGCGVRLGKFVGARPLTAAGGVAIIGIGVKILLA